jgi:hypothetical protein
MVLTQEAENFIMASNKKPAVYIYFLRRRRHFSVQLYRRELGVNSKLAKVFNKPEELYGYVEELCKRGCDLRTPLPAID